MENVMSHPPKPSRMTALGRWFHTVSLQMKLFHWDQIWWDPTPELATHGLLPRDQRIFNYRQSRARRTSESAFGILVARWRIFLTVICLLDVNVDKVIKATCILHNYLTADRPIEQLQIELGIDPDAEDANDTRGGCLLDLPNLHGYHSSTWCHGHQKCIQGLLQQQWRSWFPGQNGWQG